MSEQLLLDTHIALWLDSGDRQLRPPTRARIDACWHGGGTVFLSAVSVWEVALLVDQGHIELDIPVERWFERFLDRPGISPLPLGHQAAARAYQIEGFEHRDPADRLLIASAIDAGMPLVTYDDRIRRFARAHGRQYHFASLS